MRSLLCILATLALAAPGVASAQSGNGWKHVHTIGMMDLVVVDRAQEKNKDVYRQAIASVCAPKIKARGFCKVMFWASAGLVPRSLPMTQAQLSAMRANWTWNANTDHRSLLWSCDIDPDPNQCFR